MTRDQLFATPRERVDDFNFGHDTAAVFDDMLGRSVPFYDEIQRMTAEIAGEFAQEGSSLFDLGCSTGTTLALLDPVCPPDVKFVGVDNSADMLEKADEKLKACGLTRPYELRLQDLQDVTLENASVVVMTLTLQFLRPLHRQRLMDEIARATRPGGCFILVEKLVLQDPLLNRMYIKHYYAMKQRRGYSDLEISQKREALENVLIPYRFEENRAMALGAGFTGFETFFRWYNFCGMVAVK
jgi:tRNA (cmo5U34)-methyltransferase